MAQRKVFMAESHGDLEVAAYAEVDMRFGSLKAKCREEYGELKAE